MYLGTDGRRPQAASKNASGFVHHEESECQNSHVCVYVWMAGSARLQPEAKFRSEE